MNAQIKACYKKEYLAFFRAKRFLILALIFVGWAILGPLLIRGLGVAMEILTPVYDEMGMDVTGMTEMFGANASMGVISAISDMSSIGLISFLLLINNFAGGEQKKRSIIIPKTSGLNSKAYLTPKYIIYPLTAFGLAIIASFAAWGISALVFEVNDVTLQGILTAGILAGVSLMFYICIHITIGTATGRPGTSAVICIATSLILPNMFAVFGSELIYNPFILNIMATSVVVDNFAPLFALQEIIATIAITIVLMGILYFIALFAQNAKKIDNSGNEIRL